MKALLMHPDRDFTLPQRLMRRDRYRDAEPQPEFSPHEQALMQDLELGVLLHAMAGQEEFLWGVAQKALLSGMQNDIATILYRQENVKDCLKNPAWSGSSMTSPWRRSKARGSTDSAFSACIIQPRS